MEQDDLVNYLGFAEVCLYNVSHPAELVIKADRRCTNIIRPKVSSA